jgi:N-methylhydantoinase A
VRAGSGANPFSRRPVVFARATPAIDTPVYRRAELGAGDRFDGPAIVEERETTAVIRPGWSVEVGPDGSLVATRTNPTTGAPA